MHRDFRGGTGYYLMSSFFFKTVRILEPVLIHYLAVNLTGMICHAAGLPVDTALLTTIAAVLVLPLFLQMKKRDDQVRDGSKRCVPSLMDDIKIVILGVASNLAWTYVLNLMLVHFQFSNEVQERLFAGQFPVQLVGIGILVPIMEEVMFRGLVYNRLKDYNKKWMSMLVSCVMFSLYHGNLVQILFAFPMSMLITAVYEKYDDLRAPVCFHVAVNVSSVLITAFGMQ